MYYDEVTASGGYHENKVLRSTFLLLALSMIPTAFGSWLGMQLGFPAFMQAHPWTVVIGFLVLMFGMIFAIKANDDNGFGVLLMLIFAGLMGTFMSGAIEHALSKVNGAHVVMQAAIGTGGILTGCSLYAMNTKRDFSGLGGFLFGSLIALILVSLMGIFFQSSILSLVISAVALVLFSVYLIYDVQNVVAGRTTNYIEATLQVYLDVMNIFMSLLNILGYGNSDD